jgi:hypothetical protein
MRLRRLILLLLLLLLELHHHHLLLLLLLLLLRQAEPPMPLPLPMRRPEEVVPRRGGVHPWAEEHLRRGVVVCYRCIVEAGSVDPHGVLRPSSRRRCSVRRPACCADWSGGGLFSVEQRASHSLQRASDDHLHVILGLSLRRRRGLVGEDSLIGAQHVVHLPANPFQVQVLCLHLRLEAQKLGGLQGFACALHDS